MPGEVAGQFLPDEERAYAKDVDRVKTQVAQGDAATLRGFFALASGGFLRKIARYVSSLSAATKASVRTIWLKRSWEMRLTISIPATPRRYGGRASMLILRLCMVMAPG